MRRWKYAEYEKDNADRWLLTYSDLITLLMIFFVVMYAISKVDAEKFKTIAEALSKVLGGTQAVVVAGNPQGTSLLESGQIGMDGAAGQDSRDNGLAGHEERGAGGDGYADVENMTLEGIKARLDQFAKANGFQTKLMTSIEERGLVISIQETLLFASGSAALTPRAKEILEKVSTVLATVPNYIRVEGHTDNLPINTDRFPSNWELSVLRATNVVHVLIEDGGLDPERLSATGYGEFRPIADNKTEAGRARNRRVDLIVLRSSYDPVEPESSRTKR